jgi:hypothetical protein
MLLVSKVREMVEWYLGRRKDGCVSVVLVLQFYLQYVRLRGRMDVVSCCFVVLFVDVKVIPRLPTIRNPLRNQDAIDPSIAFNQVWDDWFHVARVNVVIV